MKKKWISYLAQVAIGAVLSCIIGYFRLEHTTGDAAGKWMAFADGFTVMGLLWFCFGGVLFASSTGFFDGLTYTFRRTFNMLIPNWNPYDGSYYDYILEKKEKRKNAPGREIFLVGVTLLIIAGILVAFWYQTA